MKNSRVSKGLYSMELCNLLFYFLLGLLLSLVNETRKVRVYGVMFPLYASYRNDTSQYVKAILRQGQFGGIKRLSRGRLR